MKLWRIYLRSGRSFRQNCSCPILHYRQYSSKHSATARAIARGWHPVIGLEIHAQIQAASKIFSGSGTEYGHSVNSQVTFLDCALPGTLPVLNETCVVSGVMTSLALNCDINKVSYFDRKHYFYADMPAGYQITQQRQPLATNGHLKYLVNDEQLTAGIFQVQLEQDSGKSIHDPESSISLIDLNRAGIGLMEIVTKPDFTTSQQAREFVKELQLILKMLNTCSCVMAEGKLRVDASISLHRADEPLGTRCEVKNLNSFGFLEKAIEYEIDRQLEIVDNGGEVENETRNFLSEEGITVAMRDKEKVHDYRFMPEPNLLPLRLYDSSDNLDMDNHGMINIDSIRDQLPLLPMARRERLVKEYHLPVQFASRIVNAPGYWELFLSLCEGRGRNPKIVCDKLLGDLAEVMNAQGLEDSEVNIKLEQLADIIDLSADRRITPKTAKEIIKECLFDAQLDVMKTVELRSLFVSHNYNEAHEVVQKILNENEDLIEAYHRKRTRSKGKLLNKIVNLILDTSKHKYDAKLVRSIVESHFK